MDKLWEWPLGLWDVSGSDSHLWQPGYIQLGWNPFCLSPSICLSPWGPSWSSHHPSISKPLIKCVHAATGLSASFFLQFHGTMGWNWALREKVPHFHAPSNIFFKTKDIMVRFLIFQKHSSFQCRLHSKDVFYPLAREPLNSSTSLWRSSLFDGILDSIRFDQPIFMLFLLHSPVNNNPFSRVSIVQGCLGYLRSFVFPYEF